MIMNTSEVNENTNYFMKLNHCLEKLLVLGWIGKYCAPCPLRNSVEFIVTAINFCLSVDQIYEVCGIPAINIA